MREMSFLNQPVDHLTILKQKLDRTIFAYICRIFEFAQKYHIEPVNLSIVTILNLSYRKCKDITHSRLSCRMARWSIAIATEAGKSKY